MTKTRRVCECPFPMHQEQLNEIEEKAEEMQVSTAQFFTLIVEEGLENMT